MPKQTHGVPVAALLAALALASCSPDAGVATATAAPEPKQEPAPKAEAEPSAAGKQAEPIDWRTAEAPLLRNHVQITARTQFVRAGEAYFSPDSRWIIFQAVPAPQPGKEPEPYYSMYAAELVRDARGKITGMKPPVRLSEPGTANTCGFFHPQTWTTDLRYDFIFGSTRVPPAQQQKSGFQVQGRNYQWMFPEETDVMRGTLASVATKTIDAKKGAQGVVRTWEPYQVRPLFERPRYDAECAYSPDGRFVVYSHVREEDGERGRPDADIWIYDVAHQKHYPIIEQDGYDGGPFFSPDGRYICYRSDRRGDDRLQLFVAELNYVDGVPVGIKREHQITDDSNVNWAPFWHPSGKYLVYGTSEVGHHNYEIFAIEVDLDKPPAELRKRRITFADGADILPVFNREGTLMMWTAQRGVKMQGEEKPSSQIWIAEVVPGGLDDPERLFAGAGDPASESQATEQQ